MQKNEILLQNPKSETNIFSLLSLAPLTARLARTRAAQRAARLYSYLFEETVTPRQAVRYFYAQLAAFATLWPFALDLGWRACFFLLFCQALRKT